MADTNTTVEGVDESINHIALTTEAYIGEATLSIERIEHIDGGVSYFVLAEDAENTVGVAYSEEKMRAVRDFLIRTLG